MSKKVKNVQSVVQVFTFLHFKIANEHFHCKTITHMSYYTYNIMLKLFIFGYNITALLLCERHQNWLRVVTVIFRTIGIYVITSTFFSFFFVFFKIQKVVTFYVFLPCFVRFLELWRDLWRHITPKGQVVTSTGLGHNISTTAGDRATRTYRGHGCCVEQQWQVRVWWDIVSASDWQVTVESCPCH